MKLEVLMINENILSVFDDEDNGLIAIEMDFEFAKSIFKFVDILVKTKTNKEIVMYNNDIEYRFNVNIGDDITVFGRTTEKGDDLSSYCHEFELDSVSFELWDFLIEYINNYSN